MAVIGKDEARRALAARLDTDAALLVELAGDYDALTRRFVATNPHTPVAALEELAGDPEPNVRVGVAGNATTPPALLERLASDPVEQVLEMGAITQGEFNAAKARLLALL